MICDKKRREVAKELRKLTAPGCIRYAEEFYEELREIVALDFNGSFEGVAGSLADLIELQRKTCRLELTDTETHGNAKVRIYECSECGRTCEEIYGKYERCPHCGAEVLDEDSAN